MTQADKELLLRDLCSRLPYGVMLNIDYYDLQGDGKLKNRDVVLSYGNIGYCSDNTNWVSVKPYLRPMSSMTEEEIETYRIIIKSLLKNSVTDNIATLYNFLNSKHLDYNGLIHLGLAIEVTEENNPYNK